MTVIGTSVRTGKPAVSKAGRQVILIDQFVAQPTQLILALERMAHDKIVKLRKFLLSDRVQR